MYLNIIVTKGLMKLAFCVAGKFDTTSLVEVHDDLVHFAHTYIHIHGYFFCRHDSTETNDDPVNCLWNCFALSHGGDGVLLSFLFWVCVCLLQ